MKEEINPNLEFFDIFNTSVEHYIRVEYLEWTTEHWSSKWINELGKIVAYM